MARFLLPCCSRRTVRPMGRKVSRPCSSLSWRRPFCMRARQTWLLRKGGGWCWHLSSSLQGEQVLRVGEERFLAFSAGASAGGGPPLSLEAELLPESSVCPHDRLGLRVADAEVGEAPGHTCQAGASLLPPGKVLVVHPPLALPSGQPGPLLGREPRHLLASVTPGSLQIITDRSSSSFPPSTRRSFPRGS